MGVVSFKERVCSVVIACATDFKLVFLDYEYLIYSKEFTLQPYYILTAKSGNYRHLTGVNSTITPYMFFEKSLNGTLVESDFNFHKTGESESYTRGVVRNKIIVLPRLSNFFNGKLIAEENFKHGKVACTLATTDNTITIGYEDRIATMPKSLLRGNELDKTKIVDVNLILRRSKGSVLFNTILQGDIRDFCKLYPNIFGCDLNQCKNHFIIT